MYQQQVIEQPSAVSETTRYAGFWRRFAAILIDGMILGLVSGALADIFFGWGDRGGGLAALVSWLYYAGMESSHYQATIGKMALGFRVTDLEGRRIGFARATLRYFAKVISVMTLFIGFAMAGWTERRQALHDLIAGTLVVSKS